MDLKLEPLSTVASLAGIVTTLRRLYRLNFDAPDAIAAALDDIDANEQQALTRIASMAHARKPNAPQRGREAD